MTRNSSFTTEQIAEAEVRLDILPPETDPKIDLLVNELIGRVADKWTLLILEELQDNGVMRFSEIGRAVEGISQKMLTQTLRLMERDGLVTRTVYPVVPPKVEYALTPLGESLGAAFCGVCVWAERYLEEIETARQRFDAKSKDQASGLQCLLCALVPADNDISARVDDRALDQRRVFNQQDGAIAESGGLLRGREAAPCLRAAVDQFLRADGFQPGGNTCGQVCLGADIDKGDLAA